MPEQTQNYDLIKQLPAEFYNRELDNQNLDLIDALIKALQDSKANGTDLTSLSNTLTQHLDDNLTWQTLTPMNGWAGTIRYAKGAHNNVYLSIGISGGVKTTGTIIAELPTGYRPGFGLEFVATTITSQAAGDNVSIGIFISVNGGIQLDGLAKENVTGYGVFGAVKV